MATFDSKKLPLQDIRERVLRLDSFTPERLSFAIKQSDVPVSHKTQGYNQYTTQKDHWLGWLNPAAGTGSYPRETDAYVSAKTVYNWVGEPKMSESLESAIRNRTCNVAAQDAVRR